MKPKQVIIFCDSHGNEPFSKWMNGLRNPPTRRRILKRLIRLESGNYGDVKAVGEGVNELRFLFGSGYRVYFGEDGDTIVVLLTGDDKGSQSRDIEQAKAYWKEYQRNA